MDTIGELNDVAFQTAEFLIDGAAVSHNGYFLSDTLRINVAYLPFGQTGTQTGAVLLRHRRSTFGNLFAKGSQLFQIEKQILGQMSAFTVAHGDQRSYSAIKSLHGQFRHGFGVFFGLCNAERATQVKNLGCGRTAKSIQRFANLFHRLVEGFQQCRINAYFTSISAGVLIGNKHVQMAAAKFALIDASTQRIFQKCKILGKTE